MIYIHFIGADQLCRILTAYVCRKTYYAVKSQRGDCSAYFFVFLFGFKFKGLIVADLNSCSADF